MLSARQKETFAFLLLRATQSQVSIYAGFSPTSLFNIPTLVCAVTHTQRSAWACVCVSSDTEEQWVSVQISTGPTSCLCSVSLCFFSLLLFPPHSPSSTHTGARHHAHAYTQTNTHTDTCSTVQKFWTTCNFFTSGSLLPPRVQILLWSFKAILIYSFKGFSLNVFTYYSWREQPKSPGMCTARPRTQLRHCVASTADQK